MKRILSWFRRRLLVRVAVGKGIHLRPGDTVLVAVDRFLAEQEIALLRTTFEANHPGVKLVFLAGFRSVTVIAGDLAGYERRRGSADCGEGAGDEPVVRSPNVA